LSLDLVGQDAAACPLAPRLLRISDTRIKGSYRFPVLAALF
jgi:hypothetical protein